MITSDGRKIGRYETTTELRKNFGRGGTGKAIDYKKPVGDLLREGAKNVKIKF